MQEEIWKDICGYCGFYQVSNLGRVRSLDRVVRNGRRRKGKMLKLLINKEGYYYVVLRNGAENSKKERVHRLVANAFIENTKNATQVNHKDENKKNNNVDNLEWCTPKYNTNYGTGIERMALTQRVPVVQLSKNGFLIAIYAGMNVAEKITGVDEAKISACCAGTRITSGGFIWRTLDGYLPNNEIDKNTLRTYLDRILTESAGNDE